MTECEICLTPCDDPTLRLTLRSEDEATEVAACRDCSAALLEWLTERWSGSIAAHNKAVSDMVREWGLSKLPGDEGQDDEDVEPEPATLQELNDKYLLEWAVEEAAIDPGPPDSKIIRNAVRCDECGDEIESVHRHDFKWCSCNSVAVDGGKSYLRRAFKDDAKFTDISVMEET